jgi:putative acetyltransferase
MSTFLKQVEPVRVASRELVRELGFLQLADNPTGMTHSHSHALIEIDRDVRTQRELAHRLRLDKSTTSRIVTRLVSQGWVRRAPLQLTARGKAKLRQVNVDASGRVHHALSLLSPSDRDRVTEGLELYAQVLRRSRLRAKLRIRPIQRRDDPGVARLIRTVMPEFGADGPGFAIHDAEVDYMSRSYSQPRCVYFVVTDGDEVMGGGGVAPLEGTDGSVCELRKMYFLPPVRGLGLGQQVMNRCLEAARAMGFKRCYLETLKAMKQARVLYERNGFQPLKGPLGSTGHFSVDRYYALEL